MTEEEELLQKLVESMDNPLTIKIDTKDEQELFERLAAVEGFQDYLRDSMGLDLKRYFLAVNETQRDQAKGAFSRTAYLRNGVIKAAARNKARVD